MVIVTSSISWAVELTDSYDISALIDNPALHQGRTRAVPHTEGQWATHVYIPVPISSSQHPKLRALLRRVVKDAQTRVPELHPILDLGEEEETAAQSEREAEVEVELHVSLSRPLFLRAHQRDEFRKAVKRIADSTQP